MKGTELDLSETEDEDDDQAGELEDIDVLTTSDVVKEGLGAAMTDVDRREVLPRPAPTNLRSEFGVSDGEGFQLGVEGPPPLVLCVGVQLRGDSASPESGVWTPSASSGVMNLAKNDDDDGST